jgi:para-nitrobenzyl esterase
MRRILRSCVIAALTVAIAAAPTAAYAAPPSNDDLANATPIGMKNIINGTAQTENGPVTGVLEGNHYVYRGIPYAAPPVGDLRWRAPQPHANWTSFNASAFGNTCPQLTGTGAFIGNEDCLTLNVWGPAATPPKKLPVIVFLHGGGNSTFDAKGIPTFNTTGEYFAEHGAVLVSVNFRLGALGFMAHSALSQENSDHISGNYGVMDQLAALVWIQKNISGFGGDPKSITLYGFSAGAVDACFLGAQRATSSLLKNLILSGTSHECDRPQTLAQALNTGNAEVQNAGCAGTADVAACMRALPASTIVAASPPTSAFASPSLWNPIVDNVLFDAPLDALSRSSDVPRLLIGNTEDELGTFLAPSTIPDDTAYAAQLYALFGQDLGDQVFAQYPSSAYPSPYRAYIAATSDFKFVCPARRIAKAFASASTVYRYLNTHALENPNPWVGRGAVHTSDLPFIFHTLGAGGLGYAGTAAEQTLSDTIAKIWITFAAVGHPHVPDLPPWLPYNVGTDPYLNINDTSQTAAGVHTANCNFWDGIDR